MATELPAQRPTDLWPLKCAKNTKGRGECLIAHVHDQVLIPPAQRSTDNRTIQSCIAKYPTKRKVVANEIVPSLLKLPKARRMAIAEQLWLSVADDSMEMPHSHRLILNERMAAYKSGRIKTVTHSELMKRLRKCE